MRSRWVRALYGGARAVGQSLIGMAPAVCSDERTSALVTSSRLCPTSHTSIAAAAAGHHVWLWDYELGDVVRCWSGERESRQCSCARVCGPQLHHIKPLFTPFRGLVARWSDLAFSATGDVLLAYDVAHAKARHTASPWVVVVVVVIVVVVAWSIVSCVVVLAADASVQRSHGPAPCEASRGVRTARKSVVVALGGRYHR